MPLDHSPTKAAFKSNVRTLMHDVGKSPHVKNQSQALAIAYSIKRRGKAEGGAAEADTLLPPPRNPMMPPESWNRGVVNTAKNVGNTIGDIVTMPRRAMDEGITTEQAVPWAGNAAMTMAGMGTPFAARGAAGIFGGKLAQTADHAALKRAEEMAASGASREDIWKGTGWFQGADKKWRFEIPDNTSALTADRSKIMGEKLNHPELYAAYPDLAKIPLSYRENIGSALYQHAPERISLPRTEQFRFQPDHPENIMNNQRLALHELQHAVQSREGFTPGGNPEEFLPLAREQVLKNPAILSGKEKDLAYETYRRLAGEVEARNVATRLTVDTKNVAPWRLEDVPLEKQTIRIPGRAMGGQSPVPWFVRNEARSMTHSGPIMSAVPGRTDRHNMKVGAGAYVVPSETVSHLGQNNTTAGHALLSEMFGNGSPYGGRSMPIKHGPGPPRPPGLPRRADGGDVGDESPVDVVTAGGEFVIPADVVARIGGGSLKHGHAYLDHWIMTRRKQHISTLKNLPPPAKS